MMLSSDYVSSEVLTLFVDNLGRCSDKTKGNVEIRVYFSQIIENAYAIYCLGRRGYATIPYGHLMKVETLPDGVRSLLDTIRESLNAHNLKEVTESQYLEIAPNMFTELGGVPATVFEAFFAELICGSSWK
jgi:hypothetical protein